MSLPAICNCACCACVTKYHRSQMCALTSLQRALLQAALGHCYEAIPVCFCDMINITGLKACTRSHNTLWRHALKPNKKFESYLCQLVLHLLPCCHFCCCCFIRTADGAGGTAPCGPVCEARGAGIARCHRCQARAVCHRLQRQAVIAHFA